MASGFIVKAIMYIVALCVGICLAYASFVFALPWFFNAPRASLANVKALSILIIACVAFGAYFASLFIPDVQLANRFVHVFGGGFAASLAVALAAHDSGLSVGRARFFLISVLVVTVMGVVNELIEFALDTFTSLLFSASRTDTWLDLLSNTVGIVLAAPLIFLTPRQK